MFANVIRNAIEAVPQGGTIILHVLASQEWNGVRRPGARVVMPIPDRASVRGTFSTPSSQPRARMARGSDFGSAVELS